MSGKQAVKVENEQAAPTPVELQVASIEREVKKKKATRSSIDPAGARNVRHDVRRLVEEARAVVKGNPASRYAKTDEEAVARCTMFVGVLDGMFVGLDHFLAAKSASVKGQVHFTPQQKAAAKALHAPVAAVREAMRRLSPDDAIEEALREAAGVGESLGDEQCFEMRDRAKAQLTALEAPANAAIFADYELDAPLYAAELKAPLAALEQELEKGVPGERTGTVNTKLTFQLRCLGVAVERTVRFLKDHGAADIAALLEAKLPHTRRSTDHAPKNADGSKKNETSKDDKSSDEKPAPESGEEKPVTPPSASGETDGSSAEPKSSTG